MCKSFLCRGWRRWYRRPSQSITGSLFHVFSILVLARKTCHSHNVLLVVFASCSFTKGKKFRFKFYICIHCLVSFDGCLHIYAVFKCLSMCHWGMFMNIRMCASTAWNHIDEVNEHSGTWHMFWLKIVPLHEHRTAILSSFRDEKTHSCSDMTAEYCRNVW